MLAARQASAVYPAQQRLGQPSQRRRPPPVCRANYRWSADIDGGRKRESLYGVGEQGESLDGGGRGSTPGGAPANAWAAAGSGASSPPQGADWGQWSQDAAANGDTQQAEWEAVAATISSERAARRAARRSAGAGRLSRRQQAEQQEQEPVQPAEQQAAWDQPAGPQWEPEPAGPTADGSEAAAGEDPWLGAEMRLLRRRQRAARRRGGTAGDGAPAAAAEVGGAAAGRPDAGQPGGSGWGGTVSDPWEAEWGPAGPAASAAAAEEWGWAEESWAQDGGRRQRVRRQQQDLQQQAAAEAGPGSAWDYAQQQAELRRRRRRRRRGGADEEDEEAGAGSASNAAGDWAGGAEAAGGFPGAGYEYLDSSDDEDDEIGWQQGQQGRGADFSAQYEPGVSVEPDIAVLSTDEVDRVLPVVPFSQQASYFAGSATDSVQRWGASLAATVILSKVAVLAASSLTWPLWWPWALAARKNLAVRRQYRYGGLWRTRVLGVTFTGRPKPFGPSADPGGLLGGSTMRLARVLIGDPGGAQAELALPYDARYELIQPGEPAELVVLSSEPSFQQFKAVKDVYLPSSGLWVSEYPHADRAQFLDVSLQVERESQEVQQWGQQQPPQQPNEQPYEQQPSEGGSYGPAGAGSWQGDGYGQPRY